MKMREKETESERETRKKSSIRVICARSSLLEHVITSLNHASEYMVKVKKERKRWKKRKKDDDCGLSEYTVRICYRAN